MTATRLTAYANAVVQWGLLTQSTAIISVLTDDATRFTEAGMVASKEARPILESITETWIRPLCPPKIPFSDRGLPCVARVRPSGWIDGAPV